MEQKKIFKGQSDNEKVLYVWGRHFITLVVEEIVPCIFIAVSLAVMVAFFYEYYIFLGAFAFFLFFSVWAFYAYFVWVRDRYIVTDHRIIDYDQWGIFKRSLREAPLDKVQDITINVHGFLGTIFHYGDVVLQTASETSLILEEVPAPEKIQRILSDLSKANNQQRNTATSNDVLAQIAELVNKANQLKEQVAQDEGNKNPAL